MFQRFIYDYVYTDQARIDMNELLCENLAVAYDFMDRLYLELHSEAGEMPNRIRLREPDTEEYLVDYETHGDVLPR
jgi:hypothetical protein